MEEWFAHLGVRGSDAVASSATSADGCAVSHDESTHVDDAFDEDAEEDSSYDDVELYGDDCVLAGGSGRRCNRGGAGASGSGGAHVNRKRIDGKTTVYSSKHVRRQVAIRTK